MSYPVLIRRLTIGSVSEITSDPTVNPLHGSTRFGTRQTICNLTPSSVLVKPLSKLFFEAFHILVDGVQNPTQRFCAA